jgi:hypothetical protein
MPTLFASDSFMLARARTLYSYLQTSIVQLRLFQNVVTLTPNTTTADLQESTFPGYSPFLTNGLWRQPQRISTGNYVISLPEVTYNVGGIPNEFCYGAYLTALGSLIASFNFDIPLDLTAPGQFPVSIGFRDVALAVAC